MAWTFMPDHPVHTKVQGHEANMRTARAQAAVWAQQQTQHPPTHSFVDLSGVRDGDEYVANTGSPGQ